MTDEQTPDTEENVYEDSEEFTIPDELELLKQRATQMGISFHPSISLTKLKERVNSALSQDTTEEEPTKPKRNSKLPISKPMTHDEYMRRYTRSKKQEAASLVRINVTCMNPLKKEWEGEIISVGSAKLGTFKKYVPFNTTTGWHVPKIIYDTMKERKCSVFHTVKNQLGVKVRKSRLVNEFNIEVLPPLTEEELKDLAQQQAMAGSIDQE